jgi:putative intracellular protease/amidase
VEGLKALNVSVADFEGGELLQPCQRAKEAAIAVEVAPLQKKPISAKHSQALKARRALSGLLSEGYKALIPPGGEVPAPLGQVQRELETTWQLLYTNKPIAAIRHAPSSYSQQESRYIVTGLSQNSCARQVSTRLAT